MLQWLALRPSPHLFPQRLQFLRGEGTVKLQIELDPLLPESIRQQMLDAQARLFHPFFAKIGCRGLQELKNGHGETVVSVSASVSGDGSVDRVFSVIEVRNVGRQRAVPFQLRQHVYLNRSTDTGTDHWHCLRVLLL